MQAQGAHVHRPSQGVWREVNLSLSPESHLSQPAGTDTAMESAKAQSRNTRPFPESFSSEHCFGMKNCPQSLVAHLPHSLPVSENMLRTPMCSTVHIYWCTRVMLQTPRNGVNHGVHIWV